MWGKINIPQFENYTDPANGDVQEVVPGKFVAFRSPLNLGGQEYFDTKIDVRLFSPAYFVEIFQDMGVSTVIRLNQPRYHAKTFTWHGFQYFDLSFKGSTCPPNSMVAAFFQIVDAAPGAVAVHCDTGIGRTGTLIALWLMRTHGFTAREAMGWLRIMRPGSVIGEQQHYLCAFEATGRAAPGGKPLRGILRTAPPASAAAAAPVATAEAKAGSPRRRSCFA